MKRNSLTTAVVAGIAGTVGIANLVNAATLNPDGLGQVLVYPYYTVNKPNNGSSANLVTQFSVINTTDQGKAVKVRFLEGRNSREVRDFNLYLSPYDVWSAAVFKLPAEEQANLVTEDTSCTVPFIRTATVGGSGGAIGQLPDGRKFVRFTNQLFASDSNYGAAGGPGRSLANTREGHFELIEMGVVGNNAGQNGGLPQNSIAAITHITTTGVPANCQKVLNAWNAYPTPGYWTADDTVDMSAASGGLFGSASIVDVDNGTMLAYSPDAVDGFYAAGGFFHSAPGDTRPSLENVGFPNTTATAYVFRNGQVITATYGAAPSRPIDAFSALFTYDAIFNEFVLGGIAAASTDWAVTFPTKGFYVDRPYRLGATGTVRAPFVELFTSVGSRVRVDLTPFDREERGPGACTGSDAGNPACDICFSPCENPEELLPVLRYETQIISFQDADDFVANRTSPVLGSALAENVDVRADNLSAGWMQIGLTPTDEPHALYTSAEGVVFYGLPVTGFAATNFVNNNVAGKLANYAGLWKHKGSRSCAATATAACS
ncbi:MAG: hypothetical protein J0L88_12265 [Xanthomonadales bacterium]|nr:hypothetical protein [Xanthomonadales bacterium]